MGEPDLHQGRDTQPWTQYMWRIKTDLPKARSYDREILIFGGERKFCYSVPKEARKSAVYFPYMGRIPESSN